MGMDEQTQIKVVLSLGLLEQSLTEMLEAVAQSKETVLKGDGKEETKKALAERLDYYRQITEEQLKLIPKARDLFLEDKEKEAAEIMKKIRLETAFIRNDANELLLFGTTLPVDKKDLH